MAEETITILRVGTEEAVRNVNDLKNNIKTLKENLGELEIGTQEYQDTLDELKVNQNALKDAMYATSSSMEDVAKAATGAGESYNSLVHRMAALKEEFRSTSDAARRADLGGQIKAVNDQLKEMDAMQGNFQRNVGNYAGSIKEAFGDMSKQVDALRKGLGAVGGGLNGVKDGFEGISKSPAIATFGILVSLAVKLAGELKENETATAALKKGMDALKPVMDFVAGIVEKLAGWLADVISKVSEFVTSNGLFQKVITGVMGVGNAILQYIVAPFKGVIAAIKVFKEQGVKGIGDAARAFGQEIKSGFSFKQNFQAGQAVAETFISGARSKRKEVKEAGKSAGKEAAEGFVEGVEEIADDLDKTLERMAKAEEEANKAAVKRAEERLKNLDTAYSRQLEMNSILTENERERAANEYAIQSEANAKKLELLKRFRDEALDRGDLEAFIDFDRQRADLEVEIETETVREKERLRRQDLKDAEEKAKARAELLKGVASTTATILGSLADMYEADEADSEKNANRIKALRIAASTIETISGAIAAYMSAQSLPFPANAIVGAAQAAAVTAAGMAEIAKMRATKVSALSSSSSSVPAPVAAVASAPEIPTEVGNVRTLTSASEEVRLNQMASDQRVYILSSDLEADREAVRTRVAESSF